MKLVQLPVQSTLEGIVFLLDFRRGKWSYEKNVERLVKIMTSKCNFKFQSVDIAKMMTLVTRGTLSSIQITTIRTLLK